MNYKYIVICLLLPVLGHAQFNPYALTKHQLDSVRAIFENTDNDTLKITSSVLLTVHHLERDRDTTIYFAERALELAQKLKQPLWEMRVLEVISQEFIRKGKYPEALNAALDGLELAQDESIENNLLGGYLLKLLGTTDPRKIRIQGMSLLKQKLGQLHSATGNDEKAIENYLEAIRLSESVDDKDGLHNGYSNLSFSYRYINKLDSALISARKSLVLASDARFAYWVGFVYWNIGVIYLQRSKIDSARHYIQLNLDVSRKLRNPFSEAVGYFSFSNIFNLSHQPDSSIFYADKALKLFRSLNDQKMISSTFNVLSTAYRYKNNLDSSFFYLQLAKTLGDSVANAEKEQTNRYLNLGFDEQLRLRKLEEENAAQATRIRTNALLGGLFTLLVVAFFLYRNGRQKQKAKQRIESAYDQLKATQTQLIQSEKMASLGELTAGIAHEIQNPLNFVNNFSEVSNELVEELKAERSKLKEERDDELENEIIRDVGHNLHKIKHHGERASEIVKSMLQHSRNSSGEKELTDINGLCDEYLRLAYHGMRAKDKSFNAEFKTEFDPDLPKINVVPQDIGRVLLNLINNAFQAVIEVEKPKVIVSTKKLVDKIEIKVSDNGPGIPEEIKDKIFQPFFTTKPTGQGTGLGLSLAYDIITKGHGGTIELHSDQTGAIFTIILFK